MGNVVKIYELRTLGYEQLQKELDSVEKSFENIKKIKQELNRQKNTTTDVDDLKKVNEALKEAKIRTAELKLERQNLINEAKAAQNVEQARITQHKQATAAINIEKGGLTDLIAKRKELKALIGSLNPGSSNTVGFDGQALSRQQAIAQYQQIDSQIRTMTKNMTGMDDIGTRMNRSLAAGFDRLKGSLGQMILMYTGWFAAFQGAGKLISENVKLSDSFADLQIRIKGSKEDVEKLFEELKKIDTRTSLAGLVDIANQVAKKGVPKEEIAALTKEFDKLNVVLGTEIGDPGHAAASIIKLITIFNHDGKVTAERVNEIGTSLFKLTTTGVATGEFLINFAERVGAVRGITGLTLPSILGMGAALQQLGQRTEVAGTAATQLTVKLFTDVPKFAALAGKSIEDFRKLLDADPFDALLAVSKGLMDLKDADLMTELGAEFEEVVRALGEVGVTGQRIRAILGDIATNGDFVKKRMNDAAVSMYDLARQTEAAEIRQNTFAATLDRVKKGLERIATSEAVRITLAAIASTILFLISNLGIIIGVIGTYAAIWAVANASMIAARVSTFALNAITMIHYAGLVIASTATRAYTAALLLFTRATGGATTATAALNAVIRSSPIGWIIALLATLAALLVVVSARAQGTTEALRRKAEAMEFHRQVTVKANEATADQISKIDTLARVVLSAKTSLDTKRAALEELISINNKFSAALKENTIDANKFKEALDEVRGAIIANAKSEAAAALTKDKYSDYLVSLSARQSLEAEFAQGDKVSTRSFDQSLRDKIYDVRPSPAIKGDIEIDGVRYNSKEFFDNLAKAEKVALDNYEHYLELAEGYKVDAINKEKQTKGTQRTLEERIKAAAGLKLNAGELGALIKEIEQAMAVLKEGDSKLAGLIAAKKSFQKRLDELKGKEDKPAREFPYKGARVGGEALDALSLIESELRGEIAKEEQRFLELQQSHRATFDEEIIHIENMRGINAKYLDQKIAHLEGIKKLNAKEIETLAGFRRDRVALELKASQDIQAIKDKDFALQSANLKKTLSNQIAELELVNAGVQGDASRSNVDKAQFQLDTNRRILSLQEQFNANIDKLEKQLNQQSKENLDEGRKTREEIIADTIAVFNAMFKDAADAADKLGAEFKIAANLRIQEVLVSDKSGIEKAREIQSIRDQLARDLLANEAARLRIEVDLFKQGKDSKLKTEKEYLEALAKLSEIETKLLETNIDKQLSVWQRFKDGLDNLMAGFKENVLGIKSYTDDASGDASKLADAIAESYRLANQAINEAYDAYWDRQRDRIELELEAQQEREGRLLDQRIAQAQSDEEVESLQAQHDYKMKELERAAAEERRQLALKEAAVNFGVSVIKMLAQYGLPYALIPIAAATLLYGVQRANIQSQQFEEGGIVPTETGGEIKGRSHKHGGVKFNYEAEGKELAIINKRSVADNRVHTITGTPMEIASAINKLGGGIEFKPGAKLRMFEQGGFLGSSFPAPMYRPSNSDDSMTTMLNELRALATEQSKRIDRLQVIQVTSTVTDAQRKEAKQNQIGILG